MLINFLRANAGSLIAVIQFCCLWDANHSKRKSTFFKWKLTCLPKLSVRRCIARKQQWRGTILAQLLELFLSFSRDSAFVPRKNRKCIPLLQSVWYAHTSLLEKSPILSWLKSFHFLGIQVKISAKNLQIFNQFVLKFRCYLPLTWL